MPLYRGDAIRLCAIPDENADNNGVFVHNIHDVIFTQPGEHSQRAVELGGVPAAQTLVLCQSGDPVCVMKTYLHDEFFNEGIPVEGVATTRLQFGSERLSVAPVDTDDPAIAGSSQISFFFQVTTDDPPAGRNGDPVDDAEDWWKNTPYALRIFYIVLFVILLLLCLLCFFLLLCGVPDFFGKKEKDREDQEFYSSAPFIPANKVRSNVMDNPHFCNAMKDPEQWYSDPDGDGEYMPSGSRDMEDIPEDEPEDDAPLLALDYWGPIDPAFSGGGRKSQSNNDDPQDVSYSGEATPDTSYADTPRETSYSDDQANDDSSFVSKNSDDDGEERKEFDDKSTDSDEKGYDDMSGYDNMKDSRASTIAEID